VGSTQLAGIEKGATTNRGGLGTVYAISAGNGRDEGDDNSYDEFSTSRFGIGVAAVGRDGKQSSYSESGIGVAIAAFGGEFQPPDVLWSTNVSGEEAFKIKAEKFPTTEAPMNYTDAGNGTSAAAPQVAGAAALLLEKNNRLGYRDVKEILMKTASKTGLEGTDGFTDNGSGFSFSHAFGAGLLNVAEALKLASNWTNLGTLRSSTASFSTATAIPDNDGITVTLPVSGAELRVEHVTVKVNVKHANRGDLRITIISPSGMKSIAQPRPKDDNADFTDYVFTSVRHWGESSNGEWQVVFEDTVANEKGGQFVDATLTIWGATK
jgi:subtilisin-like proprotein convertase family protein